MIKRIAAAALAGTALAVTLGASAASAAVASGQGPTPNTGRVTGVPGSIYPDGINNLNHVDRLASTLPL